MLSFDEIEAQMLPQLLHRLGKPAVFNGQDVMVIIDRDIERTIGGMSSATMERRSELTGLSEVFSSANRGDLVATGNQSWKLVKKDSDDGQMTTWIIKEDRT